MSDWTSIEFGRRQPAGIYLLNDEWPESIAIADEFWALMVAAPEFTRIEDESITFIVEQGEAMYYTIEHDKAMGRRILALARTEETPESTEAER